MGMDRYTKQLHHQKSQKITTGTGEPAVDSGGNGSISIRDVNGQIVLFAKYNGDWYSRDLGHNTRMGEKHLTHLSIDDSGIHAMDGFVSLAHFGQTLRIGEDSSTKSALRVASDGSITIGTSATAAVTITSAGAGTFAGALSATSGTIGGWTLSSDTIHTGSDATSFILDQNNKKIRIGAKANLTDGNFGVHLGTDGLAIGANSVFKVTKEGVLTASSGTIGGWTMAAAGLYNGRISIADTNAGVFIGQTGISLGGAGAPSFKVTSAGAVTASNVTVTGGNWTGGFSGAAWNGNAISTALQTSGSDNTNFYQDDPPTALKAGDLWFDTNDNHKAYRAAAAGADQVTSGEWVPVVTNATNITAGTLDCNDITVSNINAGSITVGTLATARIAAGSLNADKIESGTISITQLATIANIQLSGIIGVTGSTPNILIGGTLEDVGQYNIGIGTESIGAGTARTAGANYNIGIGFRAAKLLTSGDDNICIGREAGDNITTGSDNVVIGGSDVPNGAWNDQLVISSGDGGVNWINGTSSGRVLINRSSVAATTKDPYLEVDGYVSFDGFIERAGINGSDDGGNVMNFNWDGSNLEGWVDTTEVQSAITSDYRVKENITNVADGVLEKINALRPIHYTQKAIDIFQESNLQRTSFLAHEFAEQFPNSVKGNKDETDSDGNNIYQKYKDEELGAYLVKAVQELSAKVTALEAKVG